MLTYYSNAMRRIMCEMLKTYSVYVGSILCVTYLLYELIEFTLRTLA